MRKGISYEILNYENIKEFDEFTRKFIEVAVLDNKDICEWEQNWYLVKDEDKNIGVVSLNKYLFSILLDEYKDIEVDLFKEILSNEELKKDRFTIFNVDLSNHKLLTDLGFEKKYTTKLENGKEKVDYEVCDFVRTLSYIYKDKGSVEAFKTLYKKNDDSFFDVKVGKEEIKEAIKSNNYSEKKLNEYIIYCGKKALFLDVMDIEELHVEDLLATYFEQFFYDDKIDLIDKLIEVKGKISNVELIGNIVRNFSEEEIFSYCNEGKIDLNAVFNNLNLTFVNSKKSKSEYFETYDKFLELAEEGDNKKYLTENLLNTMGLSIDKCIELAKMNKYDNQVICEQINLDSFFTINIDCLNELSECSNIRGKLFEKLAAMSIHRYSCRKDFDIVKLILVVDKIINSELVDSQLEILETVVLSQEKKFDLNIISKLLKNKNLNYFEFIASCEKFSSDKSLGYLIDSLGEKEFEDSGKLKEICNLIIDTGMVPSIIKCASELDVDSNKVCEKLVNLRVESEEDKNKISAFLTSDKTDKEFVADLLGNQTDNYYNSIIFDFMRVCPKEKQDKIIDAYGNTEKKYDDGMFTMYEKTMVKSRDKE